MLDVYIPTAARIGINVTTTDAIMVNGETPIAVPANIWIGRVIVTEGDAFAFADGDSDGWAWSGTPNASASYGPQP